MKKRSNLSQNIFEKFKNCVFIILRPVRPPWEGCYDTENGKILGENTVFLTEIFYLTKIVLKMKIFPEKFSVFAVLIYPPGVHFIKVKHHFLAFKMPLFGV